MYCLSVFCAGALCMLALLYWMAALKRAMEE